MPKHGLAPDYEIGININDEKIKIEERDKSLSVLEIPFPTEDKPTKVVIWMVRLSNPHLRGVAVRRLDRGRGRRYSIGGYRRFRKMRKSRRTKLKGRKRKGSKRKGSRRKSRRTRRR